MSDRAFHLLQGEDLRGDLAPLRRYNVFVAAPTLDPVAVRAALPWARWIGPSMNACAVPADPELLAVSPFHRELLESMEEIDGFVRDATWQYVLDEWGQRQIKPTFPAFSQYAAFLCSRVVKSWRTLYLDNLWASPPPAYCALVPGAFDRWRALSLFLVEAIRTVLPDATILGNVRDVTPSPMRLDGVTIEHASGPLALSRFMDLAQHGCRLNVAWYSTLELPGVVMPGDVRAP